MHHSVPSRTTSPSRLGDSQWPSCPALITQFIHSQTQASCWCRQRQRNEKIFTPLALSNVNINLVVNYTQFMFRVVVKNIQISLLFVFVYILAFIYIYEIFIHLVCSSCFTCSIIMLGSRRKNCENKCWWWRSLCTQYIEDSQR